jgi:hypothetical protein
VCPHTSFWLSPEAFVLFKPVDSETVLEAIKNQIELLGEANKSDFGYTELIENINDFNLTDVGTYHIFSLHQKCTYLALALTLAKDEQMDMEEMLRRSDSNSTKSWNETNKQYSNSYGMVSKV